MSLGTELACLLPYLADCYPKVQLLQLFVGSFSKSSVFLSEFDQLVLALVPVLRPTYVGPSIGVLDWSFRCRKSRRRVSCG